MRRRLTVAAAAITTCCSVWPAAPALAAGGLTGKFATTIKGDASLHGALNGRWVLGFTKAGAYTITFNGATVVRGRFSIAGSTVSFGHESGPASCATPGRYTIKTSGRTLRLKRISDACNGRMGVLGHTLTKIG